MTNGIGGIMEQYEYDAFGQPYFFNATGGAMTVNNQPGSTWGNRFLFTGREYFSDLKLYDYRNRLYQPELGRFMQPDPKQFEAGDYNLYRYCHNDPVNKTDPTGLYIESAWDIFNIGLGAVSFASNASQGNWGAAAVDALGVVVDSAATAIPIIPGGAGAGIKAARAADAAVAAGRASKYDDTTKAASRVANRTTDTTRNQFERNLAEGGWQKSTSKDGKVTNYEKDGAKYFRPR